METTSVGWIRQAQLSPPQPDSVHRSASLFGHVGIRHGFQQGHFLWRPEVHPTLPRVADEVQPLRQLSFPRTFLERERAPLHGGAALHGGNPHQSVRPPIVDSVHTLRIGAFGSVDRHGMRRKWGLPRSTMALSSVALAGLACNRKVMDVAGPLCYTDKRSGAGEQAMRLR